MHNFKKLINKNPQIEGFFIAKKTIKPSFIEYLTNYYELFKNEYDNNLFMFNLALAQYIIANEWQLK